MLGLRNTILTVMMSTANLLAHFGASCAGVYASNFAMDIYARRIADKHIHETNQAYPDLIYPNTRDATKSNGLLNALERLRQDQSDTISSNDHTRVGMLKREFHDKLAGALQSTLEKRPFDIEECRKRYAVDSVFREGFEQGVSTALARLALELKGYHAEGTSAKLKKEGKIPAFKLPGTGKEMLKQLPKRID